LHRAVDYAGLTASFRAHVNISVITSHHILVILRCLISTFGRHHFESDLKSKSKDQQIDLKLI